MWVKTASWAYHADLLSGIALAGADKPRDGATLAALQAGTNASVTVTEMVPGSALLNDRVAFNTNGDWADPGEQILVDQALSAGANNLTAAIPSGATIGATFARFRVSSGVGYSYFGLATDGEVEDYQ